MLTKIGRLVSAEQGNVAIITAFCLVLIVMVTGAAVDYTNAARLQNDVQLAADSASLAGVAYIREEKNKNSSAQINPGEVRKTVLNYLNTNAPDIDLIGTDIKVDINAGKVEVRSGSQYDTAFARIIPGFDKIKVEAQSSSVVATGNTALDLVLAIDVTGSMTPIIDAVKDNARRLDQDIKDELDRRGKKLESIQIKVILFQDFWVDIPGSTTVANDQPFEVSPVFTMPQDRTAFDNFMAPKIGGDGGDFAENGLEAVTTGLRSVFPQPASQSTNVLKLVTVWTDAPAIPFESERHYTNLFPANDLPSQMWYLYNDYMVWSGKVNPPYKTYPPNMPKSLAELQTEFGSAGDSVKIVLISPDRYPWTRMKSWDKVQHVDNIYNILSGSNTYQDMLDTIVESVNTWEGPPRLMN